jgi:hypothetical protein
VNWNWDEPGGPNNNELIGQKEKENSEKAVFVFDSNTDL